MNAKSRAKLLIFLLLAALSLPLGWFGLRAFASFITFFNQGADPASIFRGNALNLPERDEARWLSLDGTEGRAPTSAQREELLAAYWEAWQAYSRAIDTGSTDDLATRWAGSAYERVLRALGAGADALTTSHHRLRLRWFSADGTVAQIESLFRLHLRTRGAPPQTFRLRAVFTLTLDQGFWRMRQLAVLR